MRDCFRIAVAGLGHCVCALARSHAHAHLCACVCVCVSVFHSIGEACRSNPDELLQTRDGPKPSISADPTRMNMHRTVLCFCSDRIGDFRSSAWGFRASVTTSRGLKQRCAFAFQSLHSEAPECLPDAWYGLRFVTASSAKTLAVL